MIGGPQRIYNAAERLRGYEGALTESGAPGGGREHGLAEDGLDAGGIVGGVVRLLGESVGIDSSELVDGLSAVEPAAVAADRSDSL